MHSLLTSVASPCRGVLRCDDLVNLQIDAFVTFISPTDWRLQQISLCGYVECRTFSELELIFSRLRLLMSCGIDAFNVNHRCEATLSENERLRLLELRAHCTNFDGSDEELCRLLRKYVRPLIDFCAAIAAIGPSAERDLHKWKIIGIDAPATFVRALQLASRLCDRFVVSAAFGSAPIVLTPSELTMVSSHRTLRLFRLGAAVFHGLTDHSNESRSYLLFCGFSLCPPQKAIDVTLEVAPYLSDALWRLFQKEGRVSAMLTEAERRVIARLREHKSNKEIAKSLGRSEATVRNQLHAIFSKLNVQTRSAAIAAVEARGRHWELRGRLSGGGSTA
jgi:DNA-binding CsgD family transcriptional regulator